MVHSPTHEQNNSFSDYGSDSEETIAPLDLNEGSYGFSMVVAGPERNESDETYIDKDILSTSKPKPRKNILLSVITKRVAELGDKIKLPT